MRLFISPQGHQVNGQSPWVVTGPTLTCSFCFGGKWQEKATTTFSLLSSFFLFSFLSSCSLLGHQDASLESIG